VAANLSAPQATYTGRSSLGMSTALRRGLEEPGCGQKPILDRSRRRQPVDRVVDGKPPQSGPQCENLITSDWKVRGTLPARGSS
jgi:hypothetical protein